MKFARNLMVLALAGLALAQPASKKVAMVLKAEGIPTVLTGQMWSDGQKVEFSTSARVTVLLLNKGERIQLAGKGSVQVSSQGLALQGVQSKRLASTQVRLGLNGENQRQIGGMTLRRQAATGQPWDSQLDRVEVSEQGVALSRPAGEGEPPRLEVFYLEREHLPSLASDFATLPAANLPTQSVFSTRLSGEKVGERWQWLAPWPLEDAPKNYSLRVYDLSSGQLQLWTRLHHADDQEEVELMAAREQVRQWMEREPQSAEPWIYLASLLEEKGLLDEAVAGVDSALKLQPGDQGLVEMKARLLLDLGRYRQASQLKQPPPNP